MGADIVIDYNKEDFSKSVEHYDIIFDAVGKISKSNSKKILSSSGVFVSVHDKLDKENSENLNFLKKLAEEEKIKPIIDKIYPWEQIVEAHRYVDKGHKRGHVVLTINNDNKSS